MLGNVQGGGFHIRDDRTTPAGKLRRHNLGVSGSATDLLLQAVTEQFEYRQRKLKVAMVDVV